MSKRRIVLGDGRVMDLDGNCVGRVKPWDISREQYDELVCPGKYQKKRHVSRTELRDEENEDQPE